MSELGKTSVEEILGRLVPERRAFHRHAESGFTEFWTASTIATALEAAGWELRIGRELMSEAHRMGVPSAEVLERCRLRALEEGAEPSYVERMAGGFTAVGAILRNGPGPVAAFRFDIDAVDVDESTAPEHRPVREGFSSLHAGSMHSCGHDGHAALGLALARLLAADREAWSGTAKIVFQPAEEGVRGAKSVVESGFLDDASTIAAGHLGMIKDGTGTFYGGVGGFLSTTKLDLRFEGRSAHAGANPELGRNALLAAATAALLIQGIPRHAGGATRVNVGRMEAGSGRNVIPSKALLALETRGENAELNEYMEKAAIKAAEGAALAYGVELSVDYMGGAVGADSDPGLMALAAECAATAGYAAIKTDPLPLGGSEDYSYMMRRVTERGGRAVYSVFGASIADAHHSPRFDFDEAGLAPAARTLWALAKRLLPAGAIS